MFSESSQVVYKENEFNSPTNYLDFKSLFLRCLFEVNESYF